MAISKEYLIKLGIEAETAEKIFAERSKEIEADRVKYNELKTKLEEKEESLENLSEEFETLKTKNANAEEWKEKFETLTNQIAEKEKQAKADLEAKEKAENISDRFTAVMGEKKFTHEAIKADYLRKFGEALDNKDFEGKSDADIFHELTKDDNAAFEGVTAFRLEGGANKGIGVQNSDAEARAVMGLPQKK